MKPTDGPAKDELADAIGRRLNGRETYDLKLTLLPAPESITTGLRLFQGGKDSIRVFDVRRRKRGPGLV
jgi:hypothetical protein